MQKVLDMLKGINITDVLVYSAIAIVTIVGIFKCIIPILRRRIILRRGIGQLDRNFGGERPPWQDVGFLGKPFRNDWRQFLVNAQQLEMRGLTCNVGDYINDETVVHVPGNSQLAELIPSLLTSLGILGTFIGLMRGLAGLDMTDASKIMEGIPTLIDGMKFAFATSVAGISCSLGFNMIHRLVIGGAYKSIDQFEQTFSKMVMPKPVDADVQLIIQNQDQNILIRQAGEEVGNHLASSIEGAIGRTMEPITASMDKFILSATKEQIDGVQRIVQQFIGEMNHSLSNQFLKLGQTLTEVNQSQSISHGQLEKSLEATQKIVSEVETMQKVSANVMERFEDYVVTLENSKEQGRVIDGKRDELYRQMQQSAHEQTMYLQQLKSYQTKLEAALQDFTIWSERNLTGIEKQTRITQEEMFKVSDQMKEGSQMLTGSYSTFVENVTEGLSRSLGMFDENINQVLNQMQDSLNQIGNIVSAAPEQLYDQSPQGKQDSYLPILSSLQTTLSDIAKSLEKETEKTAPAGRPYAAQGNKGAK